MHEKSAEDACIMSITLHEAGQPHYLLSRAATHATENQLLIALLHCNGPTEPLTTQ